MMLAYKETYIHNASRVFGSMMDFAVNDCNFDGDVFLHMFIVTGYAKEFEKGNSSVIVGLSGIELAMNVIKVFAGSFPKIVSTIRYDRTAEYWGGWALAQYQWYSGLSFSAILRYISFSEIVNMYHPFHEADITKFYSVVEEKRKVSSITNLKRFRDYSGMSQSELAEESGVSLRSIQMYEQKNKDINKAQVVTVMKLAKAIGCEVEDLIEVVVPDRYSA